MRLVHAHFPIKVFPAKDKKSIEIKNFLGGKAEFVINMMPGVTIEPSPKHKDELIIEGIDNASVSRSCALINQCMHAGKKDSRKFLDGIYVSERGLIEEE